MNADPGDAYDALIEFLYRAPIGLLQTTLSGEITMINPMSAQLLMPFVPDGNLLNLFDALEAAAPQLRRLAADAECGLVCEGLCVEQRASGERSHQLPRFLSIRMLKLAGGTLFASVGDITSAVRHETQRLDLERGVSRTDALTGLPNRAVAMERIARAIARPAGDGAHRFAVMLVDCDRFDRVNVTLGAHVGDELLRLVGERLNAALRRGDGDDSDAHGAPVAARLASDQFVLVLQCMGEVDEARGIAQRVVDALARPFSIGEALVHITASVGVVLREPAGGNAEEVLLEASIAMHEAKRAGGARYGIFQPGMKQRASQRGALETDLRRAIAEDQLFVVYQPIVSLADVGCAGVEALVRWQHPQRGVVPPVEFIGIAEETGLIGALGDFVLREACRQLAAWRRDLGPLAPRGVSVNLSRAQLLAGPFIAQVRAALAASGLPARLLQLEITESLAAQGDEVIASLHQLKALGVTLALDDFGTGYSSLSSLHQMPVDVVKIDRSFVCQIESSGHHRVLVEATMMVAKSLRMGTVAEGIETTGQRDVLRSLGCDKGQGYLFAKPMGAAAATEWLLREVALVS